MLCTCQHIPPASVWKNIQLKSMGLEATSATYTCHVVHFYYSTCGKIPLAWDGIRDKLYDTFRSFLLVRYVGLRFIFVVQENRNTYVCCDWCLSFGLCFFICTSCKTEHMALLHSLVFALSLAPRSKLKRSWPSPSTRTRQGRVSSHRRSRWF